MRISIVLFSLLLFVHGFPSGTSMFEISTRPWLYSLSQKYGTNITQLSQIPDDELSTIAQQGYKYVWFMGVWELGAYGLHHDRTDPGLLQGYAQTLPGYTMDDIIGSPYAVVDYVINPELGSPSDLEQLRTKLNALGMGLMLDFVPNHSAIDCPWVNNSESYYVRAPKGSQPPYNPNIYLPNGVAYGSVCQGCGAWTDTAQFNYWDNNERAARTKQLMTVASFADAIRCDMAYLLLNDLFAQNWGSNVESWGYSRPPTEWWADAISAVKSQYPNVVFLAEVYSPWQPNLQAVGFDYTYDKTLYDNLGSNNINGLKDWLTSNSYSFLQHSAHFVSNHDEPRAASFFGSWWRANAAALMTYTLPGMKFYWMWVDRGYSNRLDVHLRRETSESTIQDTVDLYDTLRSITNADVFNLGTWTYMDVQNNDDLIAYSWEYNGEKRLCVINFNGQENGGVIVVPNAAARNGNDTLTVVDLLSGDVFYRSATVMRTTGLDVLVNSWYAQIFQY
eukprot:TRINITY_DN10670_c0_g1_i1.p1 TRINITY_DN10670_c0_g1~~TRINITY_DN10670_c0_g1_i1.p1  ORF type:complete len:505 (-),score=114.64 TRINITY_DN10670_c0_g1_i1:32-1546(-)